MMCYGCGLKLLGSPIGQVTSRLYRTTEFVLVRFLKKEASKPAKTILKNLFPTSNPNAFHLPELDKYLFTTQVSRQYNQASSGPVVRL
jgi:hypothetical protein